MIENNNQDINRICCLKSIAKEEFGIPAKKIIDNIDLKIVVPEQIRDEIPTLNRMGYMKIDLDEISKEFM